MVQYKTLQKKPNLDPYLAQKVLSASPNQLISYVYDAAISACGRKDALKANRAVRELISALNFDYKEFALSFFQIYRYVIGLISKSRFDDAREILLDIKKTWCDAMKVS